MDVLVGFCFGVAFSCGVGGLIVASRLSRDIKRRLRDIEDQEAG